MRLYLIRHGETDSNTSHALDTMYPGRPLNDNGLRQAAALAEKLAGEPIGAVHSSDLTRAVQTATALAGRLGLEVVQSQGLREIPAGVEEGNTDWTVYLAALQQWATNPGFSLDNGETATQFIERFNTAIGRIAAGHEVAAAVSHGAALRVWIPLRASNMTVGTGGQWHLSNTDVVVLDGDPDRGWRVLTWAGRSVGR